MTEKNPVRIDKYLWAVRLFKTRSLASEACRKGRIIINSLPVKPSRIVGANEIITVRKPPVVFTFRVVEPIENRVSAKLVMQFLEDLTSSEEKAKLEINHAANNGHRDRGLGRPTKKDRRQIERLKEDYDDF
jgi:ribosome-associated heat shock protein Hsp15